MLIQSRIGPCFEFFVVTTTNKITFKNAYVSVHQLRKNSVVNKLNVARSTR